MHIALYAGQNAQRNELILLSIPLITALAHRVTLITPQDEAELAHEALGQLPLVADLTVHLQTHGNTFATAIETALQHELPDLLLIPAFTTPAALLGWRERRHELNVLSSLPIPFLRVQGKVKPIHQIIVASTGGEQALHSVPLIGQLARAYHATVTVLHVSSQDLVYFEGFAASPLSGEDVLNLDQMTGTTLHQLVAGLQAQGVTARLQILNGLVEETVLAECQHYDLLVIGSHQPTPIGRPANQRWLRVIQRLSFQDVTRDLLERSPVPVLVTGKSATQ